jgi:hypothetical protein
VANKDVGDGKQLTMIWHVDDLMASCMVNFKLTKLLCYLENNYGPKLTIHMGNKHDYLGVDLEFQHDGQQGVSMMNYIKDVVAGFPELSVGKAATPPGERLFDIREETEARPLEEECEIAFHHTTAQLLFMVTRAQWDIQMAAAFLTTRVKSPNEC